MIAVTEEDLEDLEVVVSAIPIMTRAILMEMRIGIQRLDPILGPPQISETLAVIVVAMEIGMEVVLVVKETETVVDLVVKETEMEVDLVEIETEDLEATEEEAEVEVSLLVRFFSCS